MSNFQELVTDELVSARAANGNMSSLHEAYSVILEEVDELWDEVKKKRRLRNHDNIRSELVQIAAMAQRAAEDLYFV